MGPRSSAFSPMSNHPESTQSKLSTAAAQAKKDMKSSLNPMDAAKRAANNLLGAKGPGGFPKHNFSTGAFSCFQDPVPDQCSAVFCNCFLAAQVGHRLKSLDFAASLCIFAVT